MAAQHVATMKERQPSGPYRLLGWSLGGLLAHEMTRQLTAAGDTVDTLMLLDPRLGPEMQRAAAIDETLEQSLRAIDAERFEQYRIRCEEAIAAAAVYQPGQVSASSTIFIAAQDNPYPGQWRSLVTGPLAVEHVPVAHHAMGTADSMTLIARLINRTTGEIPETNEDLRSAH
jgi:thioesterase domain-containing protein